MSFFFGGGIDLMIFTKICSSTSTSFLHYATLRICPKYFDNYLLLNWVLQLNEHQDLTRKKFTFEQIKLQQITLMIDSIFIPKCSKTLNGTKLVYFKHFGEGLVFGLFVLKIIFK
jgi:hypothetical protein